LVETLGMQQQHSSGRIETGTVQSGSCGIASWLNIGWSPDRGWPGDYLERYLSFFSQSLQISVGIVYAFRPPTLPLASFLSHSLFSDTQHVFL
jgi:hypothetical protein